MTKSKKRPFRTIFNYQSEDSPCFECKEPSVVEESLDIPFRVLVEQAERSMQAPYVNIGDQFPDFNVSEYQKLDAPGRAQYFKDAARAADRAEKELYTINTRLANAQKANAQKAAAEKAASAPSPSPSTD